MKTHPLIESESDGDDCGHVSVNEDKGDINSKDITLLSNMIIAFIREK